MATVELLEQTQEFLNATLPGDQGVDAKVRQLIEAEYLRRMARYRRVDLTLTRKYDVDFEEFTARSVSREKDYS